jgi:hypothetical protein
MSQIADFLRARYAEDATAVRANWNGKGITSERYHGTPIDPVRLLDDIEAKVALVDDLLAERHEVVDGDCWYTCAAATEERDGGTTCDDDRLGKPCDCGRDDRVNRRLAILARQFAGHPDHKGEEWAP